MEDTSPVTLFYSYSHKDEALRDRLETHLAILKRQGVIDDWHDRRIMAGTEWERQIDDHLEAADIILLLISANFVASNYCYGREMTRALQRHDDGHARVIPVILRPSDWQSAPFGRLQALPRDGKPVTSWKDRDRAFTEVARGVRAAAQALRQAGRRGPRTDRPPPSSPEATDLLLETGTVPIDSRFYVTRTADHDAARHLDSTQPTVIVKGCRQAGKSSLMARLHHAAIQAGQKSCYLNLQDVDEASLKSSGTLFRELARMLADALETDVDPDDTWSDRRGVKQNLTGFLEKAVLMAAETSLLLVLDEADLAFTYPDCRTDLFSVLRSWHNRRATDARGRWSKLRLVIAHATDPGLWIADPNQSPFNVGHRVRLDDFTREQVADLDIRHGRRLNDAGEAERLRDLLGGHPFLVRLAIYTLATRSWTLADLERAAADPTGPFAEHLNVQLDRLLRAPELAAAVRQIIAAGACERETDFQKLWAAGIVRGETRRHAALRCRLYHDYFRDRF